MTYRKKLIEVALPLEAINAEAAREKSISRLTMLHLWWARRPLAACRAVIFASLIDDPSAHPEQFPTEETQMAERERLFDIIRHFVKWENINNPMVLGAARAEIMRNTNNDPPALLDPFCGGGSIPIEAERLGLRAFGGDLNPVPVLITKGLIEIPSKYAGQPPVNPQSRAKMGAQHGWVGARGLAEDLRYYGRWMRDEAHKRIGYLYPDAALSRSANISSISSGKATIIAWLWARTVQCPNPACHAQMPLVRSFWLSSKKGKKAWIEPIVDRAAKTVRFEVRGDQTKPREGTVNRRGAICIVCGTVVPLSHVRAEGKAGRIGNQLMGVVAQGQKQRIYLSPDDEQVSIAEQAMPSWCPDGDLPQRHRNFQTPAYGMPNLGDIFTPRQLVALATFCDLVREARERAYRDAVAAGLGRDDMPLAKGGTGATAYGDAVATYLGITVSRLADMCNALCRWESSKTQVRNLFGRQAIPMIWDYAEPNVFAGAAGDFEVSLSNLTKALEKAPAMGQGSAFQADATTAPIIVSNPIISTDPPYYDNIDYADLSDFFYVWLRHSLREVYPELFGTLLSPKAQELVATPHRFNGDKQKAKEFFEQGLGRAFANIRASANPDYPTTIYYAFKQSESDNDDDDATMGTSLVTASTGWETMLEGLLKANFTITGTWPLRSELSNRPVASDANALASSIVLVCRPRAADAPRSARRDFVNALRRELPKALRELQHGNIAPVDLAQATIGPGMAVFSRYSGVMEADGSPMRVRTALQLINQALDEVLAEQEGEFDADTRWTLAWFEQFGTGEGQYGVAETLSKAKNTSVAGLADAGLLAAKGGKVRLLRRNELPDNWDPSTDTRLTVWETTQHLIRALEQDGEYGAATLLAKLGEQGEIARDLAYRLYTVCERKGWADEALAYNSLVISWPQIMQLASQQVAGTPRQQELFT